MKKIVTLTLLSLGLLYAAESTVIPTTVDGVKKVATEKAESNVTKVQEDAKAKASEKANEKVEEATSKATDALVK